MKRLFITILTMGLLLIVLSYELSPYSLQPPFNYTGANGSTCAQCHGNFNIGGGGILTEGLPVAGFQAGASYNFSVMLSHPTIRGRWGFSIAARDVNNQPMGQFSSANPNAALNDTELSHFGAVFQTGNNFTYSNLTWTAPANPTLAQQEVTFHYIGNAANGDQGLTGDFIYSGNLQAHLLPENSLPTVSFLEPSSHAIFNAGTEILLQVAASDTDGTINKVEFFYVDSVAKKLGEDLFAPYEFSGSGVEPGTYPVFARAIDNDSGVSVTDTLSITVVGCVASGGISAYGYGNIPGDRLINLASNYKYPSLPDVKLQLTRFEYGPGIDDNYGARIRGYICAPVTGNYVFYISSDNQSELWLSTDDNPLNIQRIAQVEFATGFRAYFNSSQQRSRPVHLIRGARYYVETIHKEGQSADHLSVGWQLPGGQFETPIPGTRLSGWEVLPLVNNSKKDFAESMTEIHKKWTIQIVPNPSPKHFIIKINGGLTEPILIKVFDAQGRMVSQLRENPGTRSIVFGENLKAGMYVAEIIQGSYKQRFKLVKR